MSIRCTAFGIESYLTERQQNTYSHINGRIQKLFSENLFLSDAPQDLETAKLLLDIIECCDKCREAAGEDFFPALLDSRADDIKASLKKLLAIVQNGFGGIFFECASTQKNQYYSADTLVEMIGLFHQVVPHFPEPSFLKRFSPYDQGGKAVLLQVIKNPNDLADLFKKDAAPSALHLHPPQSLKSLMQTTVSFEQMKSEAIRYLTSLDEKNRLPIEIYLRLFRHLQGNFKCKKLNNLEKKGVIALLLAITTNDKNSVLNRHTTEDLQDLVNKAIDIHEQCGEEVLISFCWAPDLQNTASLDEVIRALEHIKSSYQDFAQVTEITNLLTAFSVNKIGFVELLKTLDTNAPASNMREIEDKISLEALFPRFAGSAKDPDVVFPLPLQVLQKVKEQYKIVYEYCKRWESLRIGELVSLANEISLKAQNSAVSEDDVLRLVAIGRLAIRIEFQIYPHNTQVCVVLAQLNYPNGVVAQVKTGEGKSKVATLLAFVLANKSSSQGHIISSARSLSIRDQREHANFFRIFGIKTSHICEDTRDANYFQAQILYGTATDFEFSVMREMLFFKKLFPVQAGTKAEKRFDWVIVDEIDNLTIDTALSGARLSSSTEVAYDWVYVPILEFAKENLMPEKFISSSAILSKLRNYLREYSGGKFLHFADRFSDKKLNGWLTSAHTALFVYEEKRNYVIGLKDSIRGEKVKGILIVDAENTGRILHGSRWSGGVHEFVEVKHGLDVERESVCPISMSHPVFYQMYRSIFGISGTIGSQFEREELKSVYNIDAFDVPAHNPPQRKDSPATILKTNAEHLEHNLEVIRLCIKTGRPILVLCQSINDTEIFAKRLEEENISFEVSNEVQKKSEQEIIEKAGLSGAVTIATNNAGRGTDIKLSEKSLANGGLHVLITFYPESDRVELQARGRAGRQGQPGSSEIVLSREKLNRDKNLAALQDDEVIPYLQQQRQKKASVQKDSHIAYAVAERSAFEMVTEFYRMLNSFHNSATEEGFLNRLATFLNNRKYLKLEIRDFSGLSPKNRKIAEMVLKLVNDPQDSTIQWRIVIAQLIQRIQDHMVNDFALNFHALISERIRDSGIISALEIANRIDEISERQTYVMEMLKISLKASLTIKLDTLNKEIIADFEKQKQMWENYLDLSGRGILKYLSDMSKIDFNPIKVDNLIPTWTVERNTVASLVFDEDFDAKTIDERVTKDLDRFDVQFPRESEEELKLPHDLAGAESSFPFKGFSETNSNYQSELPGEEVEAFTYLPDERIPEPPRDGISVGLKNIANTCWANSFLKFISCTTFYDQILTDAPPVGAVKLQGTLREIIFSLRNNRTVSDSILNAFLGELRRLIPSIKIGAHNDAPEFFMELLRILQWKPAYARRPEIEGINNQKIFPRIGMTYKAMEDVPNGWGKHPTLADFQTHIDVTITRPDIDGTIDLAHLIHDVEIRKLRPERLTLSSEVGEKDIQFETSIHFVDLPKTIMVLVKRGVDSGIDRKKLDFPIRLGRNNLISFTRFEPDYRQVNGQRIIMGMIPREEQFYRIGAAVAHLSDNLNHGHYICYERSANGQMIIHDDLQVKRHASEADFGVAGYFLRLDRVDNP